MRRELTHDTGELPERFPNPGLPPHRPRRTDVDPAVTRRAERQVALLFAISILGTVGAIVAYFLVPAGETVASIRLSTLLIGLGVTLALFGVGAGAIYWAKSLMTDVDQVEERHPQRSDPATRADSSAILAEAGEQSGIARRGVLKGAVVGAVALAPLGLAVPLVGEMGADWRVSRLGHTLWERGRRLVKDPTGEPIRAADVEIGSVVHVIPEGLDEAEHPMEEKAKAIVLLVRLRPSELNEAPDREGWSYQGIVAYSKVCTHVGCPVALYEQQTHHLLCPCHQSTFDVANGAKVVFGPANRPLPQLPITVDDEGYLIAQSDFVEPVGPSYWERLK